MTNEHGIIKLSSKTLAHISEGLYRTPAGAIKELISNSFDSNATKVEITTNYPEFDIISCFDNGDGMKVNSFGQFVEGGIGDSNKRLEKIEPLKYNRPVIGRLGIGMMAIGEICKTVTIESHHEASKSAFKAEINFHDYIKKEMDHKEKIEAEYVDIGTYKIDENIEYDKEKKGFRIFSTDINPTLKRRFQKDVERKDFREIPLSFSKFMEIIYEKTRNEFKYKSINGLGEYWKLIWELSLLIPVKYLDDGPITRIGYEGIDRWEKIMDKYNKHPVFKEDISLLKEYIEKKKKELDSFNFRVFFNSMELKKPISLPTLKEDLENRTIPLEIRPFFINYDKEIYGERLKFRGYLFSQEHAVYPQELRGLHIKIKNVGIGFYDPYFLGYSKYQGPRFQWISGEIYVEEGIEDALTIGRDGFNEMHSHYIALKEYIHNRLKEYILSEISKGSSDRGKRRRMSKYQTQMGEFISSLNEEFETNYELKYVDGGDERVYFDEKNKIILINQKVQWPRGKEKTEKIQKLLIIFKMLKSYKENNLENKLYNLLNKVL